MEKLLDVTNDIKADLRRFKRKADINGVEDNILAKMAIVSKSIEALNADKSDYQLYDLTESVKSSVRYLKDDKTMNLFRADSIVLINDLLLLQAHLNGHLRVVKLSVDYDAVYDRNAGIGINVDFDLLQKYLIPYVQEHVIDAENLDSQIVSVAYSSNSHDFKWEQVITGIVYLVDNSETDLIDAYVHDGDDKSVKA